MNEIHPDYRPVHVQGGRDSALLWQRLSDLYVLSDILWEYDIQKAMRLCLNDIADVLDPHIGDEEVS